MNGIIMYSAKSFFSVLSGFVRLEQKTHIQTTGQDWMEEWEEARDDIPYYICARFNNGRHIPLPILIGHREGDGDVSSRMQHICILIAAVFAPRSYRMAVSACNDYVAGKSYECGES